MLLWGVGSTRFRAILNAVAEGNSSPPVDLRYLKKVRSRSAHVLSWITSFLEELYESEAETLPDGLNDVDCEWWEDVLGETSFYDPGQAACLPSGAPGGRNASLAVEIRWLPHGCIYEHWQTYNALFSDARSSFRYFWATWQASWSHKLKFRGQSQHAVCSTCIVHKLIIRQLGGDLVRRTREIELLSDHRLEQYKDRRVYWGIRAEAALSPLVITVIIDGMDQSKFCYPRSEFVFKSKLLEGMQRPRLHVNGLIAHHKFVIVAVSRADFPKNTNVTIELAAHALTKLKASGLNLRKAHIHLQLDNTSSSNKNNMLMRFCAYMTSSGNVASMDVMFLRKGHTHEDSATRCQDQCTMCSALCSLRVCGQCYKHLCCGFIMCCHVCVCV